MQLPKNTTGQYMSQGQLPGFRQTLGSGYAIEARLCHLSPYLIN